MFLLKKWKLVLVAVLAAFAVALTTTTASAAMPGEGAHWETETVGDQALQSADIPSEAVSLIGSNFRIWRGNDQSGNMWGSLNGGSPFLFPGSTVNVPQVVRYGPGGFAAFHTGIDSQIYWARSTSGAPGSWSSWAVVPGGNSTPFTLSVTNLSNHGDQMYLVYRSNDSQHHIWGTFFDGLHTWSSPADLGGITDHSPTVAFSARSNRLVVAHVGTDGHMWVNSAPYGANPGPHDWHDFGGVFTGRPSIVVSDTGNFLLAARGTDNNAWSMRLNANANAVSSIEQESTRFFMVANAAIGLVSIGGIIWAMLVDPLSHILFEKPFWNGN